MENIKYIDITFWGTCTYNDREEIYTEIDNTIRTQELKHDEAENYYYCDNYKLPCGKMCERIRVKPSLDRVNITINF